MYILLVAIIVIALLVMLKLAHFKHKIFLIVIVSLFLFLYATVAVVSKSNDFDFSTPSGLVDAGKIYFSWLGQGFGNLKTITGNVLSMDWVPENRTIEDLDPRNIMRG